MCVTKFPMLAVVISVATMTLMGCSVVARDADTATVPLQSSPTATAIGTVAPTPAPNPVATVANGDIMTDREPGPVTLASGVSVQNGRRGYAAWCVAGAVDTCTIYDRYGGPVPLNAMDVTQGSALTFSYLGANTISAISTLAYPFVGSSEGAYPTLRGGASVPTMQAERQATLIAPASPGYSVLVVRVSGARNNVADFQFLVRVG